MDKWDEINQRLENAMMVTSRIQDRQAAGLKDHREWLEDLTRVATEHGRRMADHERWMERHELTMQAIDERLEQITVKLDRIAELIFKDRSSNGHES
jgi:hypothetical protein